MSYSRKKIRTQIALLNNELLAQQSQVAEHQYYFRQWRLHFPILKFLAVFLPISWLGWKLRGGLWFKRLVTGLVDTITVVFYHYVRRQVFAFLK